MLLGPEGRKQLKLASRVMGLGIEFGLGLTLGYFAGRWIDGELGTTPWLSYVGMFLGLGAGFKSLWMVAKRTDLDRIEG